MCFPQAWLRVGAVIACVMACRGTTAADGFVSRAGSTPRKVVIATALADFSGSLDVRLKMAAGLVDDAAQAAGKCFPGRQLDLVVFPEFAIGREPGLTAETRAVELRGPVLDGLGAKAAEHHAWLVVPMTLREDGATGRISNAAGCSYSQREDTGVFWSNDPQRSIGAMIRELGLREMPEVIEQMEEARAQTAESRMQ